MPDKQVILFVYKQTFLYNMVIPYLIIDYLVKNILFSPWRYEDHAWYFAKNSKFYFFLKKKIKILSHDYRQKNQRSTCMYYAPNPR